MSGRVGFPADAQTQIPIRIDIFTRIRQLEPDAIVLLISYVALMAAVAFYS